MMRRVEIRSVQVNWWSRTVRQPTRFHRTATESSLRFGHRRLDLPYPHELVLRNLRDRIEADVRPLLVR